MLETCPSSQHFQRRLFFLAPLLANIGHVTRNAINLPAFLLARHSWKPVPGVFNSGPEEKYIVTKAQNPGKDVPSPQKERPRRL